MLQGYKYLNYCAILMKKKLINSNSFYIVGDIGNTDTKIFLLNDEFVKIKKIFLKTRLITNMYIYKNLKILNNKKIKNCLFSSVVPSAYKQIKILLGLTLKTLRLLAQTFLLDQWSQFVKKSKSCKL